MAGTGDLFAGVLPFVHTAEQRSFRGAARRLGVSPAAVSKAVARLEDDLGVRLLNRTSRRVSLTQEGELFLERCRTAVTSLQAGREAVSAAQRVPKGELTVSLPYVLGRRVVPELRRLTERHPLLALRVSFTDRLTRMIDEEIDVAVRIGSLESSSLVGRLLATPSWKLVASPGYLAHRDLPEGPADLDAHDCIRFLAVRGKPRDWSFVDPTTGETFTHAVSGPMVVDHGEMLLEAALAGMGVVQVFDFMVGDHLADGRLVELLPEHAAPGPAIRALCIPGRQSSPKVRAFFDFAQEVFAQPTGSTSPR